MNEKYRGQPLLSICIPTYNRTDILRKTLVSIFSQGVEENLYEVCVSDDSSLPDTEEMVKKEFLDHSNLTYKKNGKKKEAFLNSIEALKLGKAVFLKLHNDTGCFYPETLRRMIDTVESNTVSKPLVFFTMHSLGENYEKKICDCFDSFLQSVSYWSTWSSAFGIWRNDFAKLLNDGIEIDQMFPHTSLLFNMIDASNYLIDAYPYIHNLVPARKGWENLPHTFGVRYLQMVQELYDRYIISAETLHKIRADILNFIAVWAVNVETEPERYGYDFSNAEEYITDSFGNDGYERYLSLKRRAAALKLDPLLERKEIVSKFVPRILKDKRNRPLYVWGIGTNASVVETVFKSNDICIDGYIDRRGGNGVIRNGLPVKRSEEVLKDDVYVVVSMKYVDSSVLNELKKFGYGESDFCCVLTNSNE